MAWVSTEEQWDGRSSSAGQDGARKYSRKFLVQMDSMLDDSLAVRLAPGVPRIRDPYVVGASSDLGALCSSVEADQSSNGPFLWEVRADYTTRQTEPGQEQENPLARPARIRWSPVHSGEFASVDLAGRASVNSSNEPFDPGIHFPIGALSLSIQKNQASYDPVFALSYLDAINTDHWFGFAPGMAKCGSITGESATENDFDFYTVTYPFEITNRGHQPKALDKGFYYLDDEGMPCLFEDREGRALTGPQLLNGAGKPLKDARASLRLSITKDSQILFIDAPDINRFPNAPFTIKVGTELMLVTGVEGGGGFTVTRGYLGTTRADYPEDTPLTQEPYYIEFQSCPYRPFAPLQLP